MCISIACSFHDFNGNREPCTVEHYGKILNIVEVKFTSFTIILLKGDWYDSKPTPHRNPRILVDECKFTHVHTGNFMPCNLLTYEPFVYPLDVDQAFFIEDSLNRGWHIVVKYEARSKKVLYIRETKWFGPENEENEVIQNVESNISKALQLRPMRNRGDLISLEFVDDTTKKYRKT